MVLVIVGIVMVMPPVATIFHLETKIFGIPVTLIYLFTAWAALILGAFLLGQKLDTNGQGSDG